MGLDITLYGEIDLGDKYPTRVEVFERNITHNVSRMWVEAGVYEALYHSDGKLAGELIETLEAGWSLMVNEPDRFKLFNPPNGWGSYEHAEEFLEKVLEACKKYPKALVSSDS